MLQKTRLWSGLAAVFAVLLVIVIIGSGVANAYEGFINSALNVETSKIVKADGDETVDTIYYKTSVGDGTFTAANVEELFKMTTAQNVAEMEEGAALLYNNNNALPLTNKTRISVFGHASVDPAYQSNSAGTKVSESYALGSTNLTITLREALEAENFVINDVLWTALANGTAARGELRESWGSVSVAVTGSAKGSEENAAFYTALRSSYATDYDDAAIVTLARQGAEGTDLIMNDEDDAGGATGNISSLALHKNEKDMLEIVREDFDTVIVLLNSPNQMEVAEIIPYCDAILYIGFPGHQGFTGVARILNGEVNPSGHLVDTYAVNSLSAPACVNSGTETPYFSNVDAINAAIGSAQNAEMLSVQVEGIYIGYRYYETRYADSVIGGRGADSAKGSISGAWNYANEVSYTFGHGLSYTTFSQTLERVQVGADEITVTVEVENTGSVAGKSVVQIYVQTPYGDYEMLHKVEKSAIQLVGFDKTALLQPGAKETVTVTIDKYLLASYDSDGAEGYILSGGEYFISIGDDAHDALNNVLALQGYTTADGMTANGTAAKAYRWNQGFDANKYKYGENNVVVTNQFEDRDLNYWIPDSATYISRQDWDGTYPVAQTIVAATAEMIDVLDNASYVKAADAKTYEEVASNFKGLEASEITITLPMMRGVAIDDPLWYEFIYQLSVEDITNATVESFTCPAVGVLSPSFVIGDGCDSIGGTIRVYTNSGTIYPAENDDNTTTTVSIATLRYTSNNVYVGTFNPEIHANRGTCLGEESLWSKQMCAYNTGLDLHRTPFGGRSFEYMSECPTMSYLASISQVVAMQQTGVHAAPKHFCNNDQETYREGLACFTTEQAYRETNLRAFEGALRVAKAGALMQSFSRVGMIWTSYDYATNTQVLRNEWGWTGSIDTDAAPMRSVESEGTGLKFHSPEGFMAGTNQWCLDSVTGHGLSALGIAQTTNDGDLLEKMVESAIYWEYAIANSNIINGMAPGDLVVPVTPWWQTLITVSIVVFAVLTAASLALAVYGSIKKDQ